MTDKTTEALKLAEEALDLAQALLEKSYHHATILNAYKETRKYREALAEQEKQEPVISDVFFICDAYESGFGHGAKNDGLNDGSIFANKQQGEAYEFGYAEGLKRSKREPVRAAAEIGRTMK